MLAAMDDRISFARPTREQAYGDLYQEYVIDAAFLWLLRSIRMRQPHYTVEEMASLEQRIADQLDGLMASIDLGWVACEAALNLKGPGEVFTATVVSMHSRDIGAIQKAVQTGVADARAFPGLVSALGWLPGPIAHPWIGKFLNSKDMHHKYLGVAACSARRDDPGEILTAILKREDCRAHPALYARALRLIGELRRHDLLPVLQGAIGSQDPTLAFWANWSAILLGQQALVKNLRSFVLNPGPHQARAIQLALRVLPVDQGREWISALSQDPANLRAVVTATGVLGDPHAVNWLIHKMTDPKQARLAGEAFTFITGIDLERHNLQRAASNQTPIPNDSPDDNDVGMDEDENLPWPDAEKIAALWRNHASTLRMGQRYFLGKSITAEFLKYILGTAYQRQRHAAALELALIDPSTRLINTHAKVMP